MSRSTLTSTRLQFGWWGKPTDMIKLECCWYGATGPKESIVECFSTQTIYVFCTPQISGGDPLARLELGIIFTPFALSINNILVWVVVEKRDHSTAKVVTLSL